MRLLYRLVFLWVQSLSPDIDKLVPEIYRLTEIHFQIMLAHNFVHVLKLWPTEYLSLKLKVSLLAITMLAAMYFCVCGHVSHWHIITKLAYYCKMRNSTTDSD